MWLELEAMPAPGGAASGTAGTIDFDFPIEAPPQWRRLWDDIIGHVEVATDEDDKAGLLRRFTHGRGIRSLGFVNAHALNSCVTDPQFAADLLSLDILVRDGIGMRALYGLTGRIGGLNLNGTDLLPELLASFEGRRIALFGTQLAVVDRVAGQLRKSLGAEVVTADGFQADGAYLEICARTQPDLVVLGMGMPKQERVARLMKAGLHQDVAIVCGGAIFDFLSGHVARAPLWIRRCGLEWAYRLSIEPKRLFGRYVIGNPLFVFRSLFLTLRPASAAATAVRRVPTEPQRPAFSARPSMRLVADDSDGFDDRPANLPPRPVLEVVPVAPLPVPAEVPQFSANRPVIARDDLFGRGRDLDWLVASVLHHNGNALIYAPRGYGKTSLVRVFGDVADSLGHVVIYASCAKNVDFPTLIQSYLDEVPGLDATTSPAGLTIAGVTARLAALRGISLVFILDEFDRIERDDTRSQVVDLIKDISDAGAPVRFLLVGVATDAEQILGYHPSVHRCITCMPVSRLPDAAIGELLLEKAGRDGLVLSREIVEIIVTVSAGSAYHAQLIGQKLVRVARSSGRATVAATDLDNVLGEVLDDAGRIDPAIAALRGAFDDRRQAGHLVIFACMAVTDPDDLVRINPADDFAETALSECRRLEAAGIVVRAAKPGSLVCYRFVNAFTPQLVKIMQQLAEHRAAANDVLAHG